MVRVIYKLTLSILIIHFGWVSICHAQINSGLCKSSLGDPIVNISFGSGDNPGQSLKTLVPGSNTSYSYIASYGSPASPVPNDGYYSITNNVPNNSAWYFGALDHTPGDNNGYMAFFNASPTPGQFYQQEINNLCGSITYEFSAWVANALNPNKLIGVQPDITFRVEGLNGALIASFNTGAIAQNSSFTWNQFGMTFTTPTTVTSVILKMSNNNVGGTTDPGNDFAIDDITLKPCMPKLSVSFDSTTNLTTTRICSGAKLTMFGNDGNAFSNPEYTWQKSIDLGQTWSNLANYNSLKINYGETIQNDSIIILFRMKATENGAINLTSCLPMSNSIMAIIYGPINSFLIGDSTPCLVEKPMQLKVSSSGADYIWQDGSKKQTFEVKEDGNYSVLVNNICESQKLYKNVVFKDCELFIPNVFSPNNDGKNETFSIKNLQYYPSELKVFNRWGTEVYSNKEYTNDWNGSGLSDGMYYFQLTIKKSQTVHKGWVQIIGN